ncbi:hypothetical protein Adt_45313 [Abeliophyllum distichum]|uniref:Uncharacterized protein n=1 Tax=Abeliophyllum distichum TaxID=126358 RepID=A0ABD1PDC2_9LAMI
MSKDKAKELNHPNIFYEETSSKREPNLLNEGVPDDSSSGDKVSQALASTLTSEDRSEDRSSGDQGVTPICSLSRPLPRVTENFSFLKATLREAMNNYLQKSFVNVLNHGFSNFRTWWANNNLTLQNLIINSFRAHPVLLMRHVETFLKRVDAYLLKRNQNLECPTLEERD